MRLSWVRALPRGLWGSPGVPELCRSLCQRPARAPTEGGDTAGTPKPRGPQRRHPTEGDTPRGDSDTWRGAASAWHRHFQETRDKERGPEPRDHQRGPLGGDTSGGDTSGGDTSRGETLAGDTSRGDTFRGDIFRGETSRGDTFRGDTFRGETSRGDTFRGDTSRGDTFRGDISRGDTSRGDTSRAETLAGDTFRGETSRGDTSRGETSRGDTSRGDSSRSDISRGETLRGDTSRAETLAGDTFRGETSRGDTSRGDTFRGDTFRDGTSAGDTSKGKTSRGDTFMDGTSAGDTFRGDTFRDDTSVSDTFRSDTFRDGTSAGDTSRGDIFRDATSAGDTSSFPSQRLRSRQHRDGGSQQDPHNGGSHQDPHHEDPDDPHHADPEDPGSPRRGPAAFEAALRAMERWPPGRGGRLALVEAALAAMEALGVERSVGAYNALLRLLPRGPWVPRGPVQRLLFPFPRQQECGLQLLEQMERYGVVPDAETRFLLLGVFGPRSRPLRKVQRMMFWLPRFRHLDPHPLPPRLPRSGVEIARLGLHRIAGDPGAIVTVIQPPVPDTGDAEGSVQPYIVSSQSPEQRHLLAQRDPSLPVFVEGPFPLWLRGTLLKYFVLRGDPLPPHLRDPPPDPERSFYFPLHLELELERGPWDDEEFDVDEVEEGPVFALCVSGSGDRRTLARWISALQKQNPILGSAPVVFRLHEGGDPRADPQEGPQTPQLGSGTPLAAGLEPPEGQGGGERGGDPPKSGGE